MSEPIKGLIQKLKPGERVELFDIDLTVIGGSEILRFTPSVKVEDGYILWRGNQYFASPINASGFEVSGTGKFPTPRFKVSNVTRGISSLILEYGDMLGAKVVRWRTFSEYLDNGPNPQPNSHFPVDVYYVDQKSAHSSTMVEWTLATPLDQRGVNLPRRQILRDYCRWVYRRWDANAQEFDYKNCTCPYTGQDCFDKNTAAVSNSGDACGKQLKDCRARFGTTGVLPFGGFPGVTRYR